MRKLNLSWKAEFTHRIQQLAGENEAAFAKKAGISDQAFRKYLKGTIPGGENILKISRAGNCSTDWLLTGKKEATYLPEFEGEILRVCEDLQELMKYGEKEEKDSVLSAIKQAQKIRDLKTSTTGYSTGRRKKDGNVIYVRF